MNWILLSVVLCLFGFVKELRPSEAFLTLYLTGPWKNLTVEQVDNEIYPWWTYSYLIWLVPVFLLTDYLRYKPVLVIDGLAYIGTWALLLWAQGVPAMKWMQVLYGLVTAADVAYYSYLYVEVPVEHYQKITSFTRAAILTGRFVSYIIAQLLYSYNLLDLFGLHVFSFVSVCIAFVIALALPWPKHSEIFHRQSLPSESADSDVTYTYSNEDSIEGQASRQQRHIPVSPRQALPSPSTESAPIISTGDTAQNKLEIQESHGPCYKGFVFIWTEIKSVYSSRIVITWSVWWALASCGNFQVQNYVQNLWTVITVTDATGHDKDVYNGAVEAASTLIGSIMIMVVGFVPVNWSMRPELFMGIVCAGNTAFLVIMAHTSNIWVAYVMYVLFRITFATVITIATSQIALYLVKQRFGLVFGCNTFIALSVETILTVIVVDKAGLGVDVVVQFTVYGGYFAVIGMIFLFAALYHCCKPIHDPRYQLINEGVNVEE